MINWSLIISIIYISPATPANDGPRMMVFVILTSISFHASHGHSSGSVWECAHEFQTRGCAQEHMSVCARMGALIPVYMHACCHMCSCTHPRIWSPWAFIPACVLKCCMLGYRQESDKSQNDLIVPLSLVVGGLGAAAGAVATGGIAVGLALVS